MARQETVLVVDDEAPVRELLMSQVTYMGYRCRGAASGDEALEIASSSPPPAIVLSDLNMPGISGLELLDRLLALDSQMQVVMITAEGDLKMVRRCLRAGAYDYLVKPYDLEELVRTMQRALERRRLLKELQDYQQGLERKVEEKTREVLETRDIALITVAKLAECRDDTTGYHLDRIQWYCRTLAEELTGSPYAERVTPGFIDLLFKSSPLHDIGKVSIPDSILLKTDKLTAGEWEVMKTHTTRGGDTLHEVIEQHRSAVGAHFLRMAMEIAYDHHERWDGSGYPAGKRGESISLGARVVAIADAYDAITSERPYEGARSHGEALERIVRDRATHFDPVILDCFTRCERKFELIQRQMKSRPGTVPTVYQHETPEQAGAAREGRGTPAGEAATGTLGRTPRAPRGAPDSGP